MRLGALSVENFVRSFEEEISHSDPRVLILSEKQKKLMDSLSEGNGS